MIAGYFPRCYTYFNKGAFIYIQEEASPIREGSDVSRRQRSSHTPVSNLRVRSRAEVPASRLPTRPSLLEGGGWFDLTLMRAIFLLIATVVSYHFRPFRLPGLYAALLGFLFGLAIVLFETRLRRASLKRLIGAAIGSVLGILGAYLMTLVLAQTSIEVNTRSFLQVVLLLLMTYVGLIVGANKGDLLNLGALGGLFGTERLSKPNFKVLDTSVIIDGRIADICATGFVDGIVLMPRFVLRELQLVADSSDSLKRNRGRRGLDILQRIQKIHSLQVEIIEDDFPQVRDVDMKLIELAKRYDAKIVTNDFNLNKLAQLQGVGVLNINELANALKPVVLPGEIMRVFILKEGKEHNQGVAYLDDGTMVVVDNARRMISKTIDISVTSVLQTTAGKMIFGRYEEPRTATGPGRGESAEAQHPPAHSHSPRANHNRAENNRGGGSTQNNQAAAQAEHYEVVSDE